jgi:hypothetical protein
VFDPALVEGSQYNRDLAAGHRLEEGDLRLQAAQQQGMADAVYSAANAQASQRLAQHTALIQQQKEQYIAREQEKLNDLTVQAAQKVDPEAAKGTSGAQLFAAIGIAMGAFGASMTGGQNTALQIVNANIDRNIKAQETNIANNKSSLRDQQNLYRQNLDAFGDRERAASATKMQYLDQAKAMADQQYAAAKGTINEADYKKTLAGIADLRAAEAEKWADATKTTLSKQANEHYVAPQVVDGGGGGVKGKEKLYVPTLGGYARDEETARKLNSQGAQRMQINEDLRTIHTLLGESKRLNSAGDYGRLEEVRQQIEARANTVLQRSTVLRGQGAMSDGDKKVAELANQVVNIDPRGKTDAQIDRARKGLVSVADMQLTDHRLEGEANGIQLGTETYKSGPNGPEARANLQGANKVVTKKTEGVSDMVEAPKGVSGR